MDKVLTFAKKIITPILDKNSLVIDATCGNGNDTLFLAKSPVKKVYSFDIQQLAIDRATKLLKENDIIDKVTLINDCHSEVKKYISEEITAVMFNLGYLPNADHQITTRGKTTIIALKNILELLKVGGLITIVVYWGHENGKLEKEELVTYVEKLSQKDVAVLRYEFINQQNNAPFLLVLEKLRG